MGGGKFVYEESGNIKYNKATQRIRKGLNGKTVNDANWEWRRRRFWRLDKYSTAKIKVTSERSIARARIFYFGQSQAALYESK